MFNFKNNIAIVGYQLCCLVISSTPAEKSTEGSVLLLKYGNKIEEITGEFYLPGVSNKIINPLPRKGIEIRCTERYFNGLAQEAGVESGDVCYELIAGLNLSTKKMPKEYVVDFHDVVKLALHLDLKQWMLSRFWDWFLRGCAVYLNELSKNKAQARWMLDQLIKHKENEQFITGVELICHFEKAAGFEKIELLNLPTGVIRHSWILYLMLRIAPLKGINNSLSELIKNHSYKEHANLLEIGTYNCSVYITRANDISGHLYMMKKEVDALIKSGIDMTVFWRAVRVLALSQGPRELFLLINTNNNNIGLQMEFEIKIIYSVGVCDSTENDSLSIGTFKKKQKWGEYMKSLGLENISSRLSICMKYYDDADPKYFLKQLDYFKNVKEVQLTFAEKWNEKYLNVVEKLRSQLNNRKLVFTVKQEDGCNYQSLKQMNLNGVNFCCDFNESKHFADVCSMISRVLWKDVRFNVYELPTYFFDKLEGINLRNINNFAILSKHESLPSPSNLIESIGSIMPRMEKIEIYGCGINSKAFDNVMHVECSHEDKNYLIDFETTPLIDFETPLQSNGLPQQCKEPKLLPFDTLSIHDVLLSFDEAVRISQLRLPKLTRLYIYILSSTGNNNELLTVLLGHSSELVKGPNKLLVLKCNYPLNDYNKIIIDGLRKKGWKITQDFVPEEEDAAKIE